MRAHTTLTVPPPVRRAVLLIIGLSLVSVSASAALPSGAAADAGGRDPLEGIGDWPYGQALAVTYDDERDLVYLGAGGAVLILDVTDLTNPVLVSDRIQTRGLVVDLAYDPVTQRLVTAGGLGGFEIWDVRDPGSPQVLWDDDIYYYGFELPVNNVEVKDHFVILNTEWGYVRVFDIADPEHPFLTGGSSETGNSTNDIYLDELGQVHAVGAQAYVRFIVDSSGSLITNAYYESLTGYQFFLIAGSGSPSAAFGRINQYVYVLNPESVYDPVYSVIDVGHNLNDIDYLDGYLYYIRGAEGDLRIYDVSDLYHPAFVGDLTLPSGPWKLEVRGDYAYIADGYAGLTIVDVTDPSAPVAIGSYDTFGQTSTVTPEGDYAYLAENDDGVLVIDIEDPTVPVLVGQYDTPGYAYDVAIQDQLLYIADYEGGLKVADLADPVNPTFMGAADIAKAWKVAVSGDYAYVIDVVVNGNYWIRVVDVSDQGHPTEVGSIEMASAVNALWIEGDYLYAACIDNGLKILDVSTPSAPTVVATYLLPDVRDVCVRGDYAYVASADWAGGFVTLDVSDPLHPSHVSTYYVTGYFFTALDVEGLFAYVTAPSNEQIFLLYLGDPEHPVELGRYTTPGSMGSVYARDGLLYVADGSSGLRILNNDLYLSQGGDVAWEVQDSGVTVHLREVDFVDDDHGYVVGDYGTFLWTDDGGGNWHQAATGTSEDLLAVSFVDPNAGWVGGRNGVIRKTIDGGLSWTPQTSGTTALISGIEFVSANVGYADGGSALYGTGIALKTTDGGAHWQPVTPGGAPFLESLCFVDDLHGWICGDDGFLYRTVDGGASWDPEVLPSAVGDVCFVDQDTGWCCTSGTSVYKSTDGGDNWVFQVNQSAPYSTFSSISFVDSKNGWVVGGVQLGGISYGTTDSGFSWKEIQGAHEHYLQSVSFVDTEHGWAVGHDGTILRAAPIAATVPGSDDGPEVEVPERLSLSASPNPFNPTTRIAYELPGEADVTLRIYDVSGRLVRTLVDAREPAGPRSIMWNGRTDSGRPLASGVYLSELRAGGEVRRGKLAILK